MSGKRLRAIQFSFDTVASSGNPNNLRAPDGRIQHHGPRRPRPLDGPPVRPDHPPPRVPGPALLATGGFFGLEFSPGHLPLSLLAGLALAALEFAIALLVFEKTWMRER